VPDEREMFKSLLVNYASRYAVELPEVLEQVRGRFPDESSWSQKQLARDLVLQSINEGAIALLRLDESGKAVDYGEHSAERLAEDEAWVPGDAPSDFLAATTLGEALADAGPEDSPLAWEYPAG